MIREFLSKSCHFTLQHKTQLFSSLQSCDGVDLDSVMMLISTVEEGKTERGKDEEEERHGYL